MYLFDKFQVDWQFVH